MLLLSRVIGSATTQFLGVSFKRCMVGLAPLLRRGSGKIQGPPAGCLLCLAVLGEEGGQFMVSLEGGGQGRMMRPELPSQCPSLLPLRHGRGRKERIQG